MEDGMCRLVLVLALSLAEGSALAQTKDPIVLRDMGSFHLGGRLIEITGQPIKEVVFTPGGVPAKMDPNGKYQIEQMYVQYFLPKDRKGRLPLLLWHGGGLTGVTYETKPDASASARPAPGTKTRPSARPIRARSFRPMPTSSS
jgi:hypothetical protein